MNTSAQNPVTEMIDISRSFDRTYWAHRLHVNEEDLARAVRTVGPRADRVLQFLSAKLRPE
jgi:Protein of unknown function (DUF3606)